MRARLCGRAPPATGRPRGPRAGTEWESVWRHAWATRCAGVLDATPHTRGRVPARHAPSAVGDAHDAPCCAVWQVRAAAAPWRAPPGGLGAQPRRARGLDIVRRAAVRRRLGSSRSSWCSSSAPPRSPTPRSTAARCPRSRRSCWSLEGTRASAAAVDAAHDAVGEWRVVRMVCRQTRLVVRIGSSGLASALVDKLSTKKECEITFR